MKRFNKYTAYFLLTAIFLAVLVFSMILLLDMQDKKRVMADGQPYTGTASFKFVIADQSNVLWSNDGTSIDGSEPETAIELDVVDGEYTVMLGGKPMKPFYYELLKIYPDATLKVWVNTGTGFEIFSEELLDAEAIVSSLDRANQIEQEKQQIRNQNPPGLVKSESAKAEKKEEEGEKATNAGGWYEQRYKQRAGPDGKIPSGALMKAKNFIDRMPPRDDAGLWNWEWLGPGNIGGRIRAIAIHPTTPSTIFIGGVSGGIWRSTNSGSSWYAIDDFMANLAITSIVYDPTNTNIMYAATGEGFYNSDGLPGAGIFKSTNGGLSWSQLSSTNNDNFEYVNRLAHHPSSTGVLYAATRSPHRIWKTTDGGDTWTSILTTPTAATDVRVDENNPAEVLVGTWGVGGAWPQYGDVYLSTNSGSSFTHLTTGAANKLPSNGHRCEVTFCPSNSTRMYVSIDRNGGEIWRSTDNGSTWELRNSTDYIGGQGWYDNVIWVDPTNSARIVVGGVDLYRSENGGTDLTRISDWHDYHNNGSANSAHADHHIIINHPDYDGSSNKKVYFGNDGGIQMTNDVTSVTQNTGWVNLCNTTLGITQFYGGAAAPDGSIIVGGTQDNDHLRYRASGTWSGPTGWFQAETGDGGFAAINYNNTDIIYSEYTYLAIEKSTNGGSTYPGAVTGLGDAGDGNKALFIAPFSMDPNDPTRLIAGGTSIWRTTNSAGNWSSIRGVVGGKCSAIDIADGNSSIIWVGYEDGRVAKTTNGTSTPPTWTRVDNNATALPNRYVTDIAINPNNHNEVYVTFGGYNNDNVWYTNDAGASWSNRSGTSPNDLPALQVNSVRVHPSSSYWIYIGTDLGVFASEDKGQNWCKTPRYSANEGPANVEVSELIWQGDEYLIAVTHGRGMYRSHPLIVVYVDANAASGGNGSFSAPYQTVREAVNNAGPGATISIKSNTYDESNPLLINKRGMVESRNGSVLIK